jgi:hypothetical protein
VGAWPSKRRGPEKQGAKSSIYRFNVVNNDLEVIQAVIRVLDESGLAAYEEVKVRTGSIRTSYGPHCDIARARRHWAEGLGVPLSSVEVAKHPEPQKRAPFGTAC